MARAVSRATSQDRHAGTGDQRARVTPAGGSTVPLGSQSQHRPAALRAAAVARRTSGLVDVVTTGPGAAKHVGDDQRRRLAGPGRPQDEHGVLGWGQHRPGHARTQVQGGAGRRHPGAEHGKIWRSCGHATSPGQHESTGKRDGHNTGHLAVAIR